MKIFMLLILLLAPYKLLASDFVLIQGNNSPNSEVIVKVDLSRLCSHPTDNDPNYFIETNGHIINLRISITYSNNVICDPPPPYVTSYIEITLGALNSGEYQLNLFFVDSEESVITGTPLGFSSFFGPVYFQVPHVIPILSFVSYFIMMSLLLIFGFRVIRQNSWE